MGRRVFVLNAGSSSLKYRLVDVAAERAVGGGVIEDVSGDHGAAVAEALGACPLDGVVAVAHRVVHGGDRFRAPVVVDDGVLDELRKLSELAPLHNPAGVTGIELARRALPGVPHVALFDTAFHHTLPAHAHTYAVPREWGVRRYGFHGLSYAFVSRAAAEHLGRNLEETDLIVLHLGNGASAAAIAGGRSVDTSMGMTPLEGLVMGTRGGDLDPALVPHLHRTKGMAVDEIERALNSASGLRALAGAADLREVHRRVAAGDSGAAQALAVYCYRIRKYVGAYLAALGGAHAIVFTGGVGEHDAEVRARSLAGLERLGIAVDPARNAAHEVTISPPGAQVAVLVVGTDEELEMARQTAAEIDRGGSASPRTPPL